SRCGARLRPEPRRLADPTRQARRPRPGPRSTRDERPVMRSAGERLRHAQHHAVTAGDRHITEPPRVDRASSGVVTQCLEASIAYVPDSLDQPEARPIRVFEDSDLTP